MAVINAIRRTCVRVIRRLLEALKLADHIPSRQLDEEQVMMVYCQARVDPSGCPNLMVYRQRWCQKHMDQKDALRAFYHTTEDRYDSLPSQVLDDHEDIETKRTAITLLAIVLTARQAMTDWFWNGVPDDGHVEHEMVLSSKLIRVRNTLFGMKFGIIIQISELGLREVIRSALIQIPSTQKYQPEYGLDCDPDCNRVPNPGGEDVAQHRYQHQHHMADGQKYLSEQGCSDQSKGATNPWSSLDDLQYIELLDLERASAYELSSIDYLYIADVHATDHTKVEW